MPLILPLWGGQVAFALPWAQLLQGFPKAIPLGA